MKKNIVVEYEANIAYDNLFFVDIKETKCQIFHFEKFDYLKNAYAFLNNYVDSCVFATFNLNLKKWKTLTFEMTSCITTKKNRDEIVVVFRTRDESKLIEIVLTSKIIFANFEQSTITKRLRIIENRWRLKRKKNSNYWIIEIRSIVANKRRRMQTIEMSSTQFVESYEKL